MAKPRQSEEDRGSFSQAKIPTEFAASALPPLERIARGMWEQNRALSRHAIDLPPWDEEMNALQHHWIRLARAALLAVRDPDGLPFTNEVVDTEGGWETPRTVWRDTIDAILSGEA